MSDKQPPVFKRRAGACSMSVWKNTSKEGKEYPTVSLERGYQDDQGNWKSTTTMRQSDLANVILLYQEAQRFCAFDFAPKKEEEK